MFGGPTQKQYDALVASLQAQQDHLTALSALVQALSKQLGSFKDDARAANQKARVASAETHLLKALSSALMAEIAARSSEPYADLSSISKRARYTAKEFSGGDAGADYVIKEAIKMIVKHAEVYLKRGDPAGKLNAQD